GEETQGRQPARARRAVLPHARAHAPLRAGPHAARPRRRTQHQAQPRLAVHGGPAAGPGGVRHRAGNKPRRAAPGAHRVRHTDAGRAELRDWLRELVEQPQHEYPAFVAALSLIGALPPSQVLGLLRKRLGHLAERQAEIRGLIGTSLASGVPGLFLTEEEYRLALLEAEAAFVGGLVLRIT